MIKDENVGRWRKLADKVDEEKVWFYRGFILL